jgi:pimeloyl-ACP methyl ester carboxylesterase
VRKVLSVLTAGAIAVSGMIVGVPAERVASAQATAPIEWGPCESRDLKRAQARCAFLEVPLDYDRPNGRQISLRLARVRHTSPDSQYQGVMLANPGGPGAPGLLMATQGQSVPGNAGAAYDWIGFDPRGAGASRPSLSCRPNYFHYDRPPYVPGRKRLVRTWLRRSRRYAAACKRKHPFLLPNMTTVDVARDMDSIRQALGADRINFYGYSWGSYLGQVYGTLFPERVRRMVLDSNVDPNRVWYRSNLDQNIAIDRVMNLWFHWIAQYKNVYRLGKNTEAVRKRFNRQKAKLRRRPAGGKIGPSEWNDIYLPAAYARFNWTPLAEVFAGWVHQGRWRLLKFVYDLIQTPGNDNLHAGYLASHCSDVPWPQAWGKWAQDNWRVHRRAPYQTWPNAWFNAPCLYWRTAPGERVEVDGSGVNSTLLVGETLDGATPFSGSLAVRALFPNSSLIEGRGGTTHGASLRGNACIDNKVAAYLATGRRPARKPGRRSDAVCPPFPAPVPRGRAISPSTDELARRLPFPFPIYPFVR